MPSKINDVLLQKLVVCLRMLAMRKVILLDGFHYCVLLLLKLFGRPPYTTAVLWIVLAHLQAVCEANFVLQVTDTRF